ncbi:pimeloyl-ACP methyl ester carboxylesterase [Arthrobacter sp. CAN_A6]|uniref:hypothetical protein n=1 Tax=Arthrobacter sp. CAN_A6 TaxID=2787721 RepID=UPI0018C8F73A
MSLRGDEHDFSLRPGSAVEPYLAARGGVGGISFQWEELEQASARLENLAEQSRQVAAALVYVELDLGQDIPGALTWQGGAGAELIESRRIACSAVREAARSVLVNEDNLSDTARCITASRLAYLAADSVTRSVIARTAARTEETARAVAAGAIASGVLTPGPVRITPLQVAGMPVPFPGTLESLVGRIRALEEQRPGTFEVLRTAGLNGPVYLVVLPGTQGTALDTGNPFDTAGNAEAVVQDSSHVVPAVAQALRESGAQPGDRLMIAGYSQGGLHAMNLAADSGLAAKYDVELVVTVGSPTGWERSAETEYLHLEHADDAVPRVDAAPNPDELHRVTVSLDNPVPVLAEGPDGMVEGKGLGPAHKLANYAEGARLVDASALPSLVPAASLLAAAGVSGKASSHMYTAMRIPENSAGQASQAQQGKRRGRRRAG